jgi:hypothetical protein
LCYPKKVLLFSRNYRKNVIQASESGIMGKGAGMLVHGKADGHQARSEGGNAREN